MSLSPPRLSQLSQLLKKFMGWPCSAPFSRNLPKWTHKPPPQSAQNGAILSTARLWGSAEERGRSAAWADVDTKTLKETK